MKVYDRYGINMFVMVVVGAIRVLVLENTYVSYSSKEQKRNFRLLHVLQHLIQHKLGAEATEIYLDSICEVFDYVPYIHSC